MIFSILQLYERAIMRRHTEEEHKELRTLSEHLLYEIVMLEYNACRINALFNDHTAVAEEERYALLESFLIHVRTLYEFLFLTKGKKDKNALRANDFMENKPYQTPPRDPDLHRWAKTMIDERLVHLSQHRILVQEEDWEWRVGLLFDQIYQQIAEFFEWVPDEHICETLKLRKNRLIHDLSPDTQKDQPMLVDWNCNIVMGTGSPMIPRIVANPVGFPVERDLTGE